MFFTFQTFDSNFTNPDIQYKHKCWKCRESFYATKEVIQEKKKLCKNCRS